MKTPRELLLARHRAVKPKLDALRRRVVAEHVGPAPDEAGAAVAAGLWLRLWRELVWSSRWAWGGLACVWLVIVSLHFATRDPLPARGSSAEKALPLTRAALVEQHRLKAELLSTLPSPAASVERGPTPPRTQFSPHPLNSRGYTMPRPLRGPGAVKPGETCGLVAPGRA